MMYLSKTCLPLSLSVLPGTFKLLVVLLIPASCRLSDVLCQLFNPSLQFGDDAIQIGGAFFGDRAIT
jgi:hypothetical protein